MFHFLLYFLLPESLVEYFGQLLCFFKCLIQTHLTLTVKVDPIRLHTTLNMEEDK